MPRYLYLGVFFSGLASLAIEISASRLLGNYFGSSNLVWASIIGLILIYLTLGYMLGGKIADKNPQTEKFFSILAWAALLIGIIPLAARPILRYASQAFDMMSMGPLFGSFISVLILFSVPVILLGTASPFAIRLLIKNNSTSGSLAGRIYAISTLGSFIGTFLPVLWLIPVLGTYRTFVIISGLLLGITLLGLWKTSSVKAAIKHLWMPIVLLVVTLLGLKGKDKSATGMVLETESAYNYIQVLEINSTRYLRLNEGQGIHSIYHPTQLNYHGPWEEVLAAPFFNPSLCDINHIKHIAIIGLAAGTSAHQALNVFPNTEADGFEIDRKVVEIGKDFFAMQDPRLHVFIEDGRWGLKKSKTKYDIISIDAFRPPYIPWHLTTVEFFTEIRDHLNKNGTIVLNVVRIIDDRRLLNSLYMTIKQVFPSVFIMDIPNTFNSMVFATLQSSSTDNFKQNVICLSNKKSTPQLLLDTLNLTLENLVPASTQGVIFYDDHAPVEWLTNQMILDFFISGKVKMLQ